VYPRSSAANICSRHVLIAGEDVRAPSKGSLYGLAELVATGLPNGIFSLRVAA
jgi:hypothetical protein